MIPANYQCDGQLNIWDYIGETEPEEDLEFTPTWDPSELDNHFPPLDPDIASGKRKPCEYKFERFIGQLVDISSGPDMVTGTITEIQPYYTIVVDENGEDWVGTPNDTSPHEDLPTLDEVADQIKKQCDLFIKPIVTDCVNRGWEWQ